MTQRKARENGIRSGVGGPLSCVDRANRMDQLVEMPRQIIQEHSAGEHFQRVCAAAIESGGGTRIGFEEV